MSKGQEEMFHTQLSSGLPRLCSLLRSSRVSLLMSSTGTFIRFVGSFVGNGHNRVK